MAIVAQCNCGNRISVADALAGKSIRCPRCGQGIPVHATAAVANRDVNADVPTFYVSKEKIVAASCALVAIILASLFFFGPWHVWKEWDAIAPKANGDVTDVISFALQAELSQLGMYDPAKDTHSPAVQGDVIFYSPVFNMTMPDKLQFGGRTDVGPFEGWYSPETGEIEADITYGGRSFAGMIDLAKATGQFHMTGRKSNGQITAESNGQSLQIVYPKDSGKMP